MKLYLVYGSPNCCKVEAVVNHLGLKPEIIRKDFFEGDLQKDDFLEINPNGRVPALEDGDFKLWESEAINLYLANSTEGQTLFPQDMQTRAQILRWTFWSVIHYNRAIAGIAWETIIKPNFFQQDPDMHSVEINKGLLDKFTPVLNEHLDGRTFMVGNDWTLADYSIGHHEPFVDDLPYDFDKFPHIKAFYGRLRQNDNWMNTAVTPEQMGRAA